MKLLFTIAAFVQVIGFSLFFHPMHVSVTDIEFDEKDKRLEVMMRVFIDDLELSLKNKLNKHDLDLLNPKEGLQIDPLISDYLATNFKVRLDGKNYVATYLGHEQEGEAFIFYIEVPKVKKFKTIEVMNSVITETHEDQNNLVNITVKETVRSLRLTRNNPVDKITFENK